VVTREIFSQARDGGMEVLSFSPIITRHRRFNVSARILLCITVEKSPYLAVRASGRNIHISVLESIMILLKRRLYFCLYNLDDAKQGSAGSGATYCKAGRKKQWML